MKKLDNVITNIDSYIKLTELTKMSDYCTVHKCTLKENILNFDHYTMI